ncbi:DUF2612 domain-containing protein [Salmonella enterica]|nr:DUF2612 domain-containing protein [Salmonella enterica]
MWLQPCLHSMPPAPRLNALINSFNAALSPDSFINDFYDLIWNIDTAEKYGLDVWGKDCGRQSPADGKGRF